MSVKTRKHKWRALADITLDEWLKSDISLRKHCGGPNSLYHACIYMAKKRGLRLPHSKVYSVGRRMHIKPADVLIKATLRETAIANRGRATARQIADAAGTTKNAVIGHWFRAGLAGAS